MGFDSTQNLRVLPMEGAFEGGRHRPFFSIDSEFAAELAE